MPALPGLFDSFDNLDSIDIEAVSSWLKNPPDPIQLENYLANRILYPQTYSLTAYDMKVDLAILREALKISGPKSDNLTSLEQKGAMLGDNPFLNITLRKIIIPERFLEFIPNLKDLAWAFIDGLLSQRKKDNLFEDIWTISISGQVDEVVGSILLPQFENGRDILDLYVENKWIKIKAGSLIVVSCIKDRCEISYKLNQGKILGKKEASLEVYGGKLGIMVDGRFL